MLFINVVLVTQAFLCMKYRICQFIFLEIGKCIRGRGYLRVQADAWILTGGNILLVDLLFQILLYICQLSLVA
jgi:hypothetical protein